MVFKPFKPPLIRKPQSDSKPDVPEQGPPVKKQRLSNGQEQTPEAEKERKPLELKNPNGTDKNTEEKYYNVLWFVI